MPIIKGGRSIILVIGTFITFSFLSINPCSAAYFLVSTKSLQELKSTTRTHIVVSGKGNELGRAPQLSAIAQMRKLADVFPNDQVLLFTVEEYRGNEASFDQLAIVNYTRRPQLLNSQQLTDEVTKFDKLASLSVFGHSAITEGPFLDQQGGRDVRWYPEDAQFERLRGKWTEDAFAQFHGCNLGHQLAPKLAEMWGIPVAGALVGTHFETLHTDGKYYRYSSGSRGSQAANTLATLTKNEVCGDGCFRMKPDNNLYAGAYGRYSHGLPFYKFFCGKTVSMQACYAGIARSLVSVVSTSSFSSKPTFDQYAEIAREWLCPSGGWGDAFQKTCMDTLAQMTYLPVEQLVANNMIYFSPFGNSRSAHCTTLSCFEAPSCLSSGANAKLCAQTALGQNPGPSKAFVEEYVSYLLAYKYL